MLARALTVTALAGAVAASAAGPSAALARDPIVPLRDVHRGMRCTARTVVQGTTISSFDADVIDVVDDVGGTGPRILVRVSGPAVDASGIASGFSGSPVYCADAHGAIGNAGAISATIGDYGNFIGLVTPIEQMLDLPLRPPSGAHAAPRTLAARVRPLTGPLTISGLAPGLAALVERAGARAGHAVVAAPAGPLAAFAPQPLVPGASFGVAYSTGAVAAGAVGTVTYRDGATLYGFGHQLDGAGRRSLPLQDAYVFTVVGNPLDTSESSSYKLAAPVHTLGTLSSDAPNGVVGSVGRGPRTIPLTVTAHDADRGRTLRQRTHVADESAIGDPTGAGVLSTIAPLAIAQALTKAFAGAPARESGRLCLRVTLRESRTPLRFCDRYVLDSAATDGVPALALNMAADVSAALAAIDDARFAALHVTRVDADATFTRGLRLATILALRGPRAVHRGRRVRIGLRARVVDGPLETIPLTLRIPRDAPLGRRTLQLSGRAIDEPADGGDELTIVLDVGGGGSVGGQGAQTLGEVRAGFAATARYDGLSAKLGGTRWRAGRDPRLRIDGRGALVLRILR